MTQAVSEANSETPSPVDNEKQVMLMLICTYVIFAILLNSVGTVILQTISSFSISKSEASVLEGFKDLPIAIVSFMFAAYLPKFGYKRALILSMSIVTVSSALMPLLSSFLMTKLLFLSVGISFALVKVSVYALLGMLTNGNKAKHAANLSLLEGTFMLGVLAGFWIFSLFIDPLNPASTSWLNVYWLVSALCVTNLLLVSITRLPNGQLASANHITEDEQPQLTSTTEQQSQFAAMMKLVLLPFVVMFVICAFFYVLIEQGVGTWLPTFNSSALNLTNNLSVQISSIFAACLAIGRLSAGVLLRHINWFPFTLFCIAGMATLLILVIPMTPEQNAATPINSWQQVPMVAYLLPLIGLFMAPVYPIINSVVLSALPVEKHAAMTGLIVIFSALGGTFGSLLTGLIFDNFDGEAAFLSMLVPLTILAIALTLYRKTVPQTT